MFPPVVGGSGVYALEIANALGARGHDVDVFTQSHPKTDTTVETNTNVTVYTVSKTRRYLVTFETLYYSLRSRFSVDFNQYDVIHGTLMPASTIAFTDRIGIDTPIVLTSHSLALKMIFEHNAEKPADYLLKYAFHPINVIMDNVSARSADKIIAISEEMQNQLVNKYGIPTDKITTIPHGVDIEKYKPLKQQHPAVSDDKLTVLFVGRLSPIKRPDLAIRSLAATERTDIELLVAGTGRLKDDLKDLSVKIDIDGQVQFLGHVSENLPLLYSSADVTLFTSRYEGFGLVFLESMAAGTPVIGTPVGGVPDLIEDGISGFICRANETAIAKRIEMLADDPRKLALMSTAARTTAERRDWGHVAEDVESIYEDVLTEQQQDGKVER